MEPFRQCALLKQQCADTVLSHEFIRGTSYGTTSSTHCYPVTHSHRLLKILDTANQQSIWCLLALTVSTLFPQSLEYTRDDVTSLIHGKFYQPINSDKVGSFFFGQMNSKPHVSMSYLQVDVRPWMAEVVESPWLRGGVNHFPLDVWGHTIITRKLEYSHGKWTLLSGMRLIQEGG